jgi:hypothetical protein
MISSAETFLALDVQRGSIPGEPKATEASGGFISGYQDVGESPYKSRCEARQIVVRQIADALDAHVIGWAAGHNLLLCAVDINNQVSRAIGLQTWPSRASNSSTDFGPQLPGM